MSIILYKSGNTYTSPKGIQCQFQICDPFSYEHLLEDGWFKTPEEVVEDEKKGNNKVGLTKVEDKKAKIIAGLKAKKAKLIAEQNKE